jgi:glycosyltransferase involved in cell wall biosynthesis
MYSENSTNKPDCWVVYRGPLERSRLAFILQSLGTLYVQMHIIWVFPGKWTDRVQQVYSEFSSDFPSARWTVLRHTLKDFFKTKHQIRLIAGTDTSSAVVALVGDSACLFANCFTRTNPIWFINGIPEEKTLQGSLRGSLESRVQWALYRFLIRPSKIVTVSTRMSAYVARHFPGIPIMAAPTCVDTSTFAFQGKTEPDRKGWFCYLGTGAAWQALDQLSLLWQAIHQKDKSIRFRVISRDPRCQVLTTGIPSSNIEFVQSEHFKEVASYLHHSEVGFLIRRDNIINRVSFPTKLAEYLASGCWVVVTNLDWDASNYVERHQVGYLGELSKSTEQLAEEILAFRARKDATLAQRIVECTKSLDRTVWINKVNQFLCN